MSRSAPKRSTITRRTSAFCSASMGATVIALGLVDDPRLHPDAVPGVDRRAVAVGERRPVLRSAVGPAVVDRDQSGRSLTIARPSSAHHGPADCGDLESRRSIAGSRHAIRPRRCRQSGAPNTLLDRGENAESRRRTGRAASPGPPRAIRPGVRRSPRRTARRTAASTNVRPTRSTPIVRREDRSSVVAEELLDRAPAARSASGRAPSIESGRTQRLRRPPAAVRQVVDVARTMREPRSPSDPGRLPAGRPRCLGVDAARTLASRRSPSAVGSNGSARPLP